MEVQATSGDAPELSQALPDGVLVVHHEPEVARLIGRLVRPSDTAMNRDRRWDGKGVGVTSCRSSMRVLLPSMPPGPHHPASRVLPTVLSKLRRLQRTGPSGYGLCKPQRRLRSSFRRYRTQEVRRFEPGLLVLAWDMEQR
jgi:hypothetical protein